MLGHTKKHRTEQLNSSTERLNSAIPKDRMVSKDSVDWRIAAKEAFGNTPSTALNMRGLRNREGLTQEQLGQAIGVEQSNISKMERGKRQIGIKIAKRIEELFDIDYRLFL